MTYHFKAAPELYWSLLTSGATVLLLALVAFDPTTITDWRAWAVALGAGMLRSMAGAALDWLRRQMTDTLDTLAADIETLSPAAREHLAEIVRALAAGDSIPASRHG